MPLISNSLYARRALSNAMDPEKHMNRTPETIATNTTTTTTEPENNPVPLPPETSNNPSDSDPIGDQPQPLEMMKEILPRAGYLHQEDTLSFVLCKPKLLPLKSINMERMDKIQQESLDKAKEDMEKGSLE